MRRLEKLLEASGENRGPWKIGTIPMMGNIPIHYKRITCDEKEADRLATIGSLELAAAFNIKTFYTQAVLAGAMLSDEYDTVVAVTPSQYGKLIADDEPVLTSEGWKTHGELHAGDKVVSPSGRFVRVLAESTKGEANRVVTFANGDTVRCHAKHEWKVLDRNSHRERVMETDRIKDRMSKGRAVFLVPTKSAVVGEKKDLVDPYTFGVWLGDGSTTKGQICAAPKDRVTLDRCRKAYPNGKEWAHKTTGVITASFVGLAADLSKYGLCFQRKDTRRKYIPDDYLTASIPQRLELLAGLIDTDGYRDATGRFYFTTAEPTLRDTFEELIATFGWRTSTVEISPRESSSGISGKKPYWVIGFNADCHIPCELERKWASRFSKKRRLGIISIEECEPTPGKCIQVEGGMYCVGRHLIPTHNSWLLGHTAALMAYRGKKLSVAAATAATTDIIMTYTRQSIRSAAPDIKDAIVGETMKKIDRLDSSLSKGRLSYARGGYIEALTLGDTFGDLSHNKAVGRGTGYIIDEAALVSDGALAEIGRREYSSVDGTKELLVMISNPHQAGEFYDALTDPTPPEGTLIIWSDALTACQEGRWTPEHILGTKFAKKIDTATRYLLCELPQSGQGMFGTVDVIPEAKKNTYRFLGVDAAYKGKDKIYVGLSSLGEKAEVDEIMEVFKPEWVDGVTGEQIADDIARYYHLNDCVFCCVDQGYGVWLIEALAKRGVNVLGVNFGSGPSKERVKDKQYAATNANNMRAEMHLDLQDMIEMQTISFTQSAYEKVKDVLPLVTATRRANGKLMIRPKIEIKNIIGHSPDEFDSVLLSVHALVMYCLNERAFITE